MRRLAILLLGLSACSAAPFCQAMLGHDEILHLKRAERR